MACPEPCGAAILKPIPIVFITEIMKTKFVALVAMLAAGALSALADSAITTVVNGVAETRGLVRMTFPDRETVTLHFADDSSLDADISLVAIALDHSGASAIDDIIVESAKTNGVFNLKGQRVAESFDSSLAPGIYVSGGRKILVK